MSKFRATKPREAELSTRFKRGRTKTGGRQKGTPNHKTMIDEVISAVKEAVKISGGKGGEVSCLRWLARTCPKEYLFLLGEIMIVELKASQPGKRVTRARERL